MFKHVALMMKRLPVKNRAIEYRCYLTTNAKTYQPSWEDEFSRLDLLNPWSNRDLVSFPAEHIILDKTTRHVVQLLQELRSFRSSNSTHMVDRATTKRCNRALENLDIGSAKAAIHGQAARAYEILEGMEALEEVSSDFITIPHPTAETYRLVLRNFAKDPEGNPLDAAAVVKRMEQRYKNFTHFEMMPTITHWNDVLRAWAVNTQKALEEDRAYNAANLLQQLKVKRLVDSSSYSHTLKSCLVSCSPSSSKRARALGLEIGNKVFNDYKVQVKNKTIEADSFPYSLYLQICRYLPDTKRRHKLALSAYDDGCERGVINNYVLDSLSKALSPAVYQKRMDTVW
eukprot:CAMPEP_0194216234 /NCGR_PEP_ID=MMETSP0156-20130528/18588_1 /TAXON_ID=33649 /ORGANISM="Thalassionema nitzschioides, Strain L26-B" /LENGTH=342 /DNA_ID=CAMNT_0038944953 /DNA_START=216 /DNA_END=1241 /DNA_ORIENTATION=+